MKKYPIVVLAALEAEALAVANLGLGVEVVLTGVGKVAAAMNTQRAIDVHKPAGLVFVGVAGGLVPDLVPMSVLIGRDTAQWDVDLTAFGQEMGTLNDGRRFFAFDPIGSQIALEAALELNWPARMGRIISGDSFVADRIKAARLQRDFSADALDMESAAAAQVATDNQIPMVLLRVVSDSASEEATGTFENFLKAASERAAQVVARLLSEWSRILD